jgi:DNA-binding PadR family transcriptional regulator
MRDVTKLVYALLELLARRAGSGYDLARELRRPVAYFWRARHSQIYPELARLEAQGLVAHHVVEQDDRPDNPDKKVYAVTAAGRAALRTWVASELDEAPVRDELVLWAYSVWLADPGAAALFREHERRHEAQLAQYQQIEAEILGPTAGVLSPVDTPEFAAYATLRRGLGRQREAATWCRWLAYRLEAAAGTPGGAGERGD